MMKTKDVWESIDEFMNDTGYKRDEMLLILSEIPDDAPIFAKGTERKKITMLLGVKLLLDERAAGSIYVTHISALDDKECLDALFDGMAKIDAMSDPEETEKCYYCGHPLIVQLFMIFDNVYCPYCDKENYLA